MQERTRQRLLLFSGILLLLLLGFWWYSGFSLDFMRFFAAEPKPAPSQAPPPGCYYQEVQCIQAPCPPMLVCPSCLPRPACLDASPPCDIAEPAGGYCPPGPRGMVVCSPATQSVQVGAYANLSASGGSGQYEWFAPDGTVNDFGPNGGAPAPGTVSVQYGTPGTKKVTVQSGRNDGSTTVDSVACTVIVTP